MDKHAEAVGVCRTLEQAGFPTMLAGGCVRDRLLGLEPKDFDLATTATPAQVKGLFRARGQKVIPVGEEHGTVCLVTRHQSIEITTLREDVHCDGRHAQVVFASDFRSDALRRDFTINAMFEDHQGQVHDYTGGLEDLKLQRLRFVGNAAERIREDYLRILRYFRFLGRFGWRAEAEQLEAITTCLDGLAQLSAERIYKELDRILASDHIARCLPYLVSSGVMNALFPWFQSARIAELTGILSHLGNAPEAMRWHALFHFSGPAWEEKALNRVMEALRFSRVLRRRVLGLEAWCQQMNMPWEGGLCLMRIAHSDRDFLEALSGYIVALRNLGLESHPSLLQLLQGLLELDEPKIPQVELMSHEPKVRGRIVDLARMHYFLDRGRGTVDLKEIVAHPEEYRIPMRTDLPIVGSRLT